VESVYYHPDVQRCVAQRHSTVVGGDPESRLATAKATALAHVRIHSQRLAERAVEKAIRGQVLQKMPRRQDIAAGAPVDIRVDTPAFVRAEVIRLHVYIDAGDLWGVISNYPLRETPALDAIAESLAFADRGQYESSVRKLLLDDNDALAAVRALLGEIASDLPVPN
jgi:hypothetical protein